MISVIIPLYNKEKTIKKTIESILNQSYYDLEIIVIDDGSTDKSLQEVKGSNDKVKIYSEGKNYGANWARNLGTHKVSGDYLFFCDADIILKRDTLKKLKNALDENFNVSYAYCSFKLGWKVMRGMSFDEVKLKEVNYISTMSLIRRKDFSGFDENLVKFQDWDLWLTMLEQGKRGVFVDEILFEAIPDKRGKSRWLPKIFYKLPLKEVKKYNEALQKIKLKHKL
ncbi:MAG: hypothetical protein COU51_00575 [Parcubacteria group bacterium CG10_big_fil_rev_8_21_14_0_10_36_14]|nr:MAG: hypothetical protein COU51_00575 [Parcubacteria group bacterium CG10_big_fil_rev_8_21_14_0_10_36_14]